MGPETDTVEAVLGFWDVCTGMYGESGEPILINNFICLKLHLKLYPLS